MYRTIKCLKRTVTVRSFSKNLELARSMASHSIKSAFIIMGDNSEYWVVSGADAQRLEKVAYELLPIEMYA